MRLKVNNNLTDIRAEVEALGDQELILEVVKAIGWEVQDGDCFAKKTDGGRFLLADPKVFGHCMLGPVFDLTSERVSWTALNEVVSAAWADLVLGFCFETSLRLMTGLSEEPNGPNLFHALMLKPRQICVCIVMAQRMRG